MLENASDSIKYRTKRDLLGESVENSEMKILQEKILLLPKVKKTFSTQQSDGMHGNELHGGYFNGIDTNIMFLLQNGVEISDSKIIDAKNALLNWTNFERDSFYKAGVAMDNAGRGGFKAIIADVLLDFGCNETTSQIKEQIEFSLDSFKNALSYTTIDNFSKACKFKGQESRYYSEGKLFPAANHLKMLSKTLSWRNKENLTMVEISYNHCKNLMKDYFGNIYVNCGYFIGPFNINWHTKEVKHIDDFEYRPIDFAWWMRSLYFSQHKLFDAKINRGLLNWIYADDILSKIPESYLKQFKNYVSIEPSWRKKESIYCDLLFPIVYAIKNSKSF